MASPDPKLKGPIAFMAGNHVAANMLMLVFLVGGLMIGRSMKEEVFPEFELDMVSVTVTYPGATPEEVEDAIVRPVELAVSGIENVKRIRSAARENVGTVTLEILEGADTDQAVQDVKSEVDRILTFPEEAERPIIQKLTTRREVITLLVHGNVSERSLREHAERVRDDLQAMPNITQVEIAGARPYEISIEIPEENLRKYNLTLPQVTALVRAGSLDLAGGSIKAEGGEVLIRTVEKRYTGAEFDSVAVFRNPDGTYVRLGEIARIKDAFADLDQAALVDGQPAVMVKVFRIGDQRPTDIAATVHRYIEDRNAQLPETVGLVVYQDLAEILEQRIHLLLKNGMLGMILVLITLSIFLEIRLAFWVAMGIVISFLGAMLVLPAMDISINMISLFAFLTVLGIVVDDAIVVGENIYVHRRMGKPLLHAAVDGAREVSLAVVFAAITTTCAFGSLLFVGGFIGNFLDTIPKIVLTVLAVSIIEALFILPSHLSGGLVASRRRIWQRIEARRAHVDVVLRNVIDGHYARLLAWCRRNRYTTLAIAVGLLLTFIGIFRGGLVKFDFMPEVEADEVVVALEMPPGTPFEITRRHALRIQEVGERLIRESDRERADGRSNLRRMVTLLGQQIVPGGPHGVATNFASNLAQVRFLLQGADERTISTTRFAQQWRSAVGEVPGVERLNFRSDLVRGGADVEIDLSHAEYDRLLAAVERLKEELAAYAGVREVADSHSAGKRELKVRLRPEAGVLGVSERELAVQVRSAFYGAEAMRIQRGQNEVKVMVRYPEEDRRTLATIDQMRIRSPLGGEIPFAQAAYIDEGRGFSTITRTDRRRVVTVTATVDRSQANANEILSDLQAGALARLRADYPGLTYDLEGTSRDQRESLGSIMTALAFGLFLIFAALAVPFRSFMQPFVVMSVIPFGIIGAMIGHFVMGYNLSMISLFGMVALTGVVVNDSLVMIDFINRARRSGTPLSDAIMESGKRRFRPIIMTSATTFFGLMPMILETSLQARFLVPMALSLGFGVLFATAITLLLVPTLYLILEDLHRALRGARAGG